ncbi:hypothetical protein [Mameliella sediminis]|uniref:COG3904 family protein n=1 Tax=Mameliella sediminis TaxID=2836866 RepID=UPI001C4541BF|nr:hypothetical protein [Mameliella sediminis]MBY6116004.1 hypothetical protein [Antarctobacter heliothermus]MBY6145218.1 hypothetical protein [Mameliella alba]MBV7394043.1 hypothetical protein [Mameliella sediminis]MBY6162043.1 hypothetical protein [Mameliella alba]MBY6170513.1 hypothetical protein [Mameliella alba]
MNRSVARTMSAVLIFQVGIGVLLVLGDMRNGTLALPGFKPDVPRLSEPVRPGDQRRVFSPRQIRPAVSPERDPGELPDRLTLTFDSGTWRLEGGIAEGDAERLIPQIDRADPPIASLLLQSPGGSVRDALDLGRHLRASGIATEVLAGEFCYSACPYLFAGGKTRQAAASASIGVHQHYFGENTLLPAFTAVEDIQRGQAEVMGYLDDMGISPLVMRHALATPPDEIYVLLPEELERYGFITNAAPDS